MSTIDADALAYLGEVRETASQVSDLLQETYKTLGAAKAVYERSRWFSDGGDLNVYDENVAVRRIVRQMGYLANSMSELCELSVVLEAARGADAVFTATDEAIRDIRETHEVLTHA
jgi:hypothetical protein